jgi:hypothetical protein
MRFDDVPIASIHRMNDPARHSSQLLTQEQDEEGSDTVSVIFALRVLDDGWVAVVWPSGDHEALMKILGLKWPAKMKSAKVWYGE